MPAKLPIIVLTVAALATAAAVAFLSDPPDPTDDVVMTDYSTLPANRWVKIDSAANAGWTLQSHSGIAFHGKRKSLVVFGSDTHSTNWDNSVHEFNPATLTWNTPAEPSPESSYGIDRYGQAVAGDPDHPRPWAMHTYDGIAYDPRQDALVVVAIDPHNPRPFKNVQGVKYHPTWLYSLETGEWRTFLNEGSADPRAVPNFFASASAYDPDRDVLWALKGEGLWFIDEQRKNWKKVNFAKSKNPSLGLSIHFNMVYDTVRHQLAVFGNYQNTRKVLLYRPGVLPDEPGTWTVRTPGGDPYPEDSQVPAAFDDKQGLFLLLPEDNRPDGRSTLTMLYDTDADRYIRVAEAGAPSLLKSLHFLLAYDRSRGVFWLVTQPESATGTVDVWAFRLDHSRLNPPGS